AFFLRCPQPSPGPENAGGPHLPRGTATATARRTVDRITRASGVPSRPASRYCAMAPSRNALRPRLQVLVSALFPRSGTKEDRCCRFLGIQIDHGRVTLHSRNGTPHRAAVGTREPPDPSGLR